ncbi:hypothetical protein EJB05_34860, partial [Eragrostis curvula]
MPCGEGRRRGSLQDLGEQAGRTRRAPRAGSGRPLPRRAWHHRGGEAAPPLTRGRALPSKPRCWERKSKPHHRRDPRPGRRDPPITEDRGEELVLRAAAEGFREKQDVKYKDVERDAIDMFEECHTSTKTGMSEAVKDALVPKTPAEAVAQVLPSRTFLRNVGLEAAVPKRSSKARVHELEAQVQAEKQCASELREKFEALDKKVMEFEAAREKEREEMAQARKKEQEEMEAARKKQEDQLAEMRKQYEVANVVLRAALGLNKE